MVLLLVNQWVVVQKNHMFLEHILLENSDLKILNIKMKECFVLQIIMIEKIHILLKGEFCFLRRCLYWKELHDYVLDYGKLFWETYKDNRKILRIYFIDPLEPSGEVAKYVDTRLYNFLTDIYQRNLFEKTIIF